MMIVLSIVGLFTLAILFAKEIKEALSNQAGTYCLVKCWLALTYSPFQIS